VSSGAETWLGVVGSERLAAALPLRVGAIGPAAAFVDGVRADARELWRDGRRSFLVTLRPMEPVTIHPAAALTDRQREVAACARNGAKAAAIAEALAISVHTARQHLQAVYRALGVSNRVELRMALDDLDSLGLDQPPSAAR
jgi:DNA-binding NarL/FixJ family response regulator